MVPFGPDDRGPRRHEVDGCGRVLWSAQRDGVGRRSGTLLDLLLFQGREGGCDVVVGTLLSCGCSGRMVWRWMCVGDAGRCGRSGGRSVDCCGWR